MFIPDSRVQGPQQTPAYKIRTSGISRIGSVVKFVLVEIGYVVPTSTNFA